MQLNETDFIMLASNTRGLSAALQAVLKIKSHTQLMHHERAAEIGLEVERTGEANLQLALDIAKG